MKSKSILTINAVLVLLLSACGAKAVPTVNPAQVQASAVAAANTMVAMTQAAVPTENSRSANGCRNRYTATHPNDSALAHKSSFEFTSFTFTHSSYFFQ